MRTNFDNTKIWINTLEESRKIQKKLFDLGYKWCGTRYTLHDYYNEGFFIYADKTISKSTLRMNFNRKKDFDEIKISDIIKPNWKERLQ